MQILSHHQKTTFRLKKKKATTVYRGAVQLLCGCILQKMRFGYYLHSPYLMASGEESRDTVVRVNTIISEMSVHCLCLVIPNPTLYKLILLRKHYYFFRMYASGKYYYNVIVSLQLHCAVYVVHNSMLSFNYTSLLAFALFMLVLYLTQVYTRKSFNYVHFVHEFLDF